MSNTLGQNQMQNVIQKQCCTQPHATQQSMNYTPAPIAIPTQSGNQPSYAGVNIQIFNPSLTTSPAQTYNTNSTYNTNPTGYAQAYPSNYYTNTMTNPYCCNNNSYDANATNSEYSTTTNNPQIQQPYDQNQANGAEVNGINETNGAGSNEANTLGYQQQPNYSTNPQAEQPYDQSNNSYGTIYNRGFNDGYSAKNTEFYTGYNSGYNTGYNAGFNNKNPNSYNDNLNNSNNNNANNNNRNVENIQNITKDDNDTKTNKKNEKQTEKRTIVQLTDEYIKNLENYLDSQDKEIRQMGAKEVLARLEEDKSRKDDLALNALVNKIIQDPYTPIRVIGLSALDSRLVTGDDFTISLLKNMQQQKNAYGQDSLSASDILLKMSGQTIEKEFEVEKPSKGKNNLKENKS
ncbi:MAG: hypothetical protein R3Y28_05125 [Candidatus Gastranaerophilales bacterium]